MAKEEKSINNNNERENTKQVAYNYEFVHNPYIIRDRKYRKLEGEKLGPFRITKVHTNVSARIQQIIVNERVNTRRLTPQLGDTPTYALVLSHWVLRLLGLVCYSCLLSCIRFWFLSDSPASIREASVKTIGIYITIKETFGYLPKNPVWPLTRLLFSLRISSLI